MGALALGNSPSQLPRISLTIPPDPLWDQSHMANGIFTPVVSITSTVGGIAVNVPSVSNKIIPISVRFLVVLFNTQHFSTASLAFAFSPGMP